MKNSEPQSPNSERDSLVLAALEAELKQRQNQNRLASYRPYSRQKEFHAAGQTHRERLFMAGNQLGKTWAGGFEVAMHLAGRYPDWWPGRVWDRPIVGWAAGVTGESTRDNPQRILLGRQGQFGTGAIPKDCIIDTSPARGVPDAIDSIVVRHGGGGDVQAGQSMIAFKSYEKGREKWQGETLDLVWYDEEPPEDIYTEGLTRTNATGGMVIVTFTPLLGMSEVVRRFLIEANQDRSVTKMTIDDAEHYTPEERARIIASYPAHEREARAKGIPTLGSGRIFPVEEAAILCKPFQVPDYWPQIGALDFGWDHPTAAVRLAWDRDDDVVYVTATHRLREATPVIHAATLKPWGDWLPWAWPHDGLQHDKGSGEQLASQYRAQGLSMLPERATFPDGTNGVEAGLMDMLTRMQTGRLKVFNHLEDWLEEFRLYHRKDGRVVKEHDDLMSATRYGVMSLRFAQTEPEQDDYDEEYSARGRSSVSGY